MAGLYDSQTLSELVLSRIELDSDYKITLLNGFITVSTTLQKITLTDNGLANLEVLRGLHRNKTLKEITIGQQLFEREKVEFNKDGTMKRDEKEKKDEDDNFTDIRGNCSVEKVSLM